MPLFRYQTTGRWYKGNTHLHSNASDGGMTLEGLDETYAGYGYDFMFLTDHWLPSRQQCSDFIGRLLWLDGMELDGYTRAGRSYHVVCLGDFRLEQPRPSFEEALIQARRAGGFLILAHPHWTGNDLQDACRPEITGFDGFDGVEIYNYDANWVNGKGNGLIYWNAMLESGLNVLAFASDDAHLRGANQQWGGGWIVVNAPVCTPDTIINAIRNGNYYSSTGPEINSIHYEDGHVLVETSSVKYIRLVGPASLGIPLGGCAQPEMKRASFKVPWDWAYHYIEIEDAHGRKAWTNTLFR